MAVVTITTKLDAVNRVLLAIGESPVSVLTGTLSSDAARAVAVLDEVDLDTQSRGWHFNTEYALYTPTANRITVGASVVRFEVDTVRAGGAGDYTVRDSGGTMYLYDLVNNTFDITTSLYATTVTLYDFEKTPEAYKRYVTIKAARTFVDRMTGDQARHIYTAQDEAAAFKQLKQFEGFHDTRTIFDGYSAARPLLREYPRPFGSV